MKPNHISSAAPLVGALCLALLLPFTAAHSATDPLPPLAQQPLATLNTVPPNIFFINDDSGSMNFETMINDTVHPGTLGDNSDPADFKYNNVSGIASLNTTLLHPIDPDSTDSCTVNDGLPGYPFVLQYVVPQMFANGTVTINMIRNCDVAAEEEWRARFHEINPLYYNPKTTYRPWPGTNPNNGDAAFKDMTLGEAWIDPSVVAADKIAINLTEDSAVMVATDTGNRRTYYATEAWKTWCTRYAPGTPRTACTGWRYYYRDTPGGPIKLQWVKDLAPADRTNFANWFSYHRNRMNAAKNAIGSAVDNVNKTNPSGIRLGYAAINDITNNDNPNNRTADFALIVNNNASNVLNKLYTTTSLGSTPLRNGLDWAGRYYEIGETTNNTDQAYPSPILSNTAGGACQLNNTILMTDGFDTGSFSGVGNADGDNGKPYADTYSETLADVAMHYYERDLAPGITNGIKPSPGSLDLAKHQHMNTYTIAFGLKGTIGNTDMTEANLSAIYTKGWPDPKPITSGNSASTVTSEKIDDLFHAAVNGRGLYFSASNSEQLIDALDRIVTSIGVPSDSSNTVATSAFRLDDKQLVITTSFNSKRWSGTIKALRVNSDGSINETTPAWNSDITLPFENPTSLTPRNIITYDGTAGIKFDWASLSATQKASLKLTGDSDAIAELRLKYLRGQQVTDPTGLVKFRERSVVLGDIVNSSPVYVGAPTLFYPDSDPFGAATQRYNNFWYANKDRTPTVYVGANDGMLHGFNATDGKELLAYVPNATFGKLANITDRSFDSAHQYFVDQTPTVADAFFAGSVEWRTVLVSGLGAGGRGLFALDVTDPTAFTKTNVLWEFTNSNDSDLGYTLAKPVIGMTEDKKWVAISGNGYGSDGGKAALFILNLDADASDGWSLGSEYRKMSANDSTDTVASPNALFSPAAVDSDGNGLIDHVYAGDLKGNIWVFDLKANTSRILFTAKDNGGKVQPITAKPTVIVHPSQPTSSTNKPNMMVLFGTGRYLSKLDVSNNDQQSFYAVWDNGSARNLGRSSLATQTFVEGTDSKLNIEARLTNSSVNVNYSATDISKQYGWYLDLNKAGTPSERVVSSASVYKGIVFFTTYIPSNDPCNGGGDSWFMFLKASNGGPPDKPIISINNDRLIEEGVDVVRLETSVGKAPSGLKIAGGAFGVRITQDSIIINTVNKDDGNRNLAHNLSGIGNLGKRISWRELRAD